MYAPLNLCPGKLTTDSNLKYTYTCKTLLSMITFIMFVRFLYNLPTFCLVETKMRYKKHLLLKLNQIKSLDYIFLKIFHISIQHSKNVKSTLQ